MIDRRPQLLKILALDQRDTFALYALAQEHAKHGDLPAALDAFDRCLAVDPLYAYAYFHKARCQQQSGQTPAARQTVLDGLRAAHQAGDAKALNELSELQRQLAEQP